MQFRNQLLKDLVLVFLLSAPAVKAVDAGSPGFQELIPQPVQISAAGGFYTMSSLDRITVQKRGPGLAKRISVARYLADLIRKSTGYDLSIQESDTFTDRGFFFRTGHTGSESPESYHLAVESQGIKITASEAPGLFRAVQTVRQLFPAKFESPAETPGPWQIATGEIRDYPRFQYRGFMLDVARHFFRPGEVKKLIDAMAAYKLNVLHLHLSDDQGWRIEVKSWPQLTEWGSEIEVGGLCRQCFYSQAEFRELVAYARERYITVIPEIDLPGHTNAALASYPGLTCDGVRPDRYTGTDVGFSSLCSSKELTYNFVNDVIREISALTPGTYFHIGGDEAHNTEDADYRYFIGRIKQIVSHHNKYFMGWQEIGARDTGHDTLGQIWRSPGRDQPGDHPAVSIVDRGGKVLVSQSTRIYLDMAYNPATRGYTWAGYNSVRDAYEWDPGEFFPGIREQDILGVEAPLWGETLRNLADAEFMAFPRLQGVAELGWSPQSLRSWPGYRNRLAQHKSRMIHWGIRFYESPLVSWD